jgi:hypothetical protein
MSINSKPNKSFLEQSQAESSSSMSVDKIDHNIFSELDKQSKVIFSSCKILYDEWYEASINVEKCQFSVIKNEKPRDLPSMKVYQFKQREDVDANMFKVREKEIFDLFNAQVLQNRLDYFKSTEKSLGSELRKFTDVTHHTRLLKQAIPALSESLAESAANQLHVNCKAFLKSPNHGEPLQSIVKDGHISNSSQSSSAKAMNFGFPISNTTKSNSIAKSDYVEDNLDDNTITDDINSDNDFAMLPLGGCTQDSQELSPVSNGKRKNSEISTDLADINKLASMISGLKSDFAEIKAVNQSLFARLEQGNQSLVTTGASETRKKQRPGLSNLKNSKDSGNVSILQQKDILNPTEATEKSTPASSNKKHNQRVKKFYSDRKVTILSK